MTAAQEAARLIVVGGFEFDHPKMIRARRLWAELLEREGELAEGDEELVTYFQVPAIRDRLMADVIDPYVWDDPEYSDLFRGARRPTEGMVNRMRHATQACRNLSLGALTEDLPPMLMISTMIQWLVGNSIYAAQGAAIALKIDPNFELAQLMLSVTSRGLVPLWVSSMSE